jgi:hypothetical protein
MDSSFLQPYGVSQKAQLALRRGPKLLGQEHAQDDPRQQEWQQHVDLLLSNLPLSQGDLVKLCQNGDC